MKQFDIEGFRNFLTRTIARFERELEDARNEGAARQMVRARVVRAQGHLSAAKLIEHSLATFTEEVKA